MNVLDWEILKAENGVVKFITSNNTCCELPEAEFNSFIKREKFQLYINLYVDGSTGDTYSTLEESMLESRRGLIETRHIIWSNKDD
jgi:hypothetical protein